MPLQLLRPNTVAIFATDPTGAAGVAAKLSALLLTQAKIDVPGRFKFDTVSNISRTVGREIARSPMERATASNQVKLPVMLSVTGTLSATPLFAFGGGTGALGSLVRRDLLQLEALERLADRGEPLVVVTPSKVHPSMGLASIQDVHQLDHKVDLTLAFEEMRIVSPLSVTSELDINSLLSGAGGTSNLGGQPTGVAPDPGGLL